MILSTLLFDIPDCNKCGDHAEATHVGLLWPPLKTAAVSSGPNDEREKKNEGIPTERTSALVLVRLQHRKTGILMTTDLGTKMKGKTGGREKLHRVNSITATNPRQIVVAVIITNFTE